MKHTRSRPPRFVLVEEHLQSAIIEPPRRHRLVVLYVDRDRIHTINASAPSVGDHVIRVSAKRLLRVHGRGWVAHVGRE